MKHTLTAALLLAFITFSPVASQGASWDGTSVSASLQGSGTQADPFQISSGADLKYLQENFSKHNGPSYYYILTSDIDMGNHPFEPIAHSSTSFQSNFDGQGFRIYNLLIDWGPIGSNARGLFGFVKGNLRNIWIDNARITRQESTAQTSSNDIKIGVLAGAASPYSNDYPTTFENIIITNATIDDGGHNIASKSLYVGGLIGSIADNKDGYQNMNNAGPVTISNIYCDVDIDLSASVRSGADDNQSCQFNVGGIVGRLRKGKYTDIPINCYYTGKVNAPLATISPVLGMSRCNSSNTASNMDDSYRWEVLTSPTATSYMALNDATMDIYGNTVTLSENRLFGNYFIYDSKSGAYAEITDIYPMANDKRPNIRTLKSTS